MSQTEFISKIIAHGAAMYCSLGIGKPSLIMTSQTFRRIVDTLVSTESDNRGMTNISSFGAHKCSLPNPPHTPQPQGWQQAAEKDSIDGMKELTKQPFCMCVKGGRVSFVNTGSNSFVESE